MCDTHHLNQNLRCCFLMPNNKPMVATKSACPGPWSPQPDLYPPQPGPIFPWMSGSARIDSLVIEVEVKKQKRGECREWPEVQITTRLDKTRTEYANRRSICYKQGEPIGPLKETSSAKTWQKKSQTSGKVDKINNELYNWETAQDYSAVRQRWFSCKLQYAPWSLAMGTD